MFTKTKSRTAKKPSRSKGAKTKQKVWVGGKRGKPVFYKRWEFYAAGLLFGLIGIALLVLTQAATGPVECKSLSSSGSTIKFCVATMPAYSALRATADYVAVDTKSPMTSATLSLELCSPQTLACTPIDTSSTILLYTTSQPRYQHLYTHGVTLLRGALYRTSFTMTTKAGRNLKKDSTPNNT